MHIYFLKFKGSPLKSNQCKNAWLIPSLMQSWQRELCVMFCFSRKAASWLTGDTMTCDVLKCHVTAFNGKLLPLSLA